MFIFLSKFLPLFIYPVGLTFVLLVLALIFRNKNKMRNGFIIAAMLLVFISGNRWVAMSLIRSLEWRYMPIEKTEEAEVAVVLGGATEPAQYPRTAAEVNGAADRMLYAARLYKDGSIKTLLLSGGSIPWYGAYTSPPALEMQEILNLTGVPNDVIWLETRSQNTYENALYSAEILKEHDVNKVLLITSAMHMPRSVKLFEAQGLEVIPAPTDYTVTQAGWQNLWHPSLEEFFINLLPTYGNISQTTYALKEYVGMTVYSLQGWMK